MQVEEQECKTESDLVFPGDIITTEATFMRYANEW